MNRGGPARATPAPAPAPYGPGTGAGPSGSNPRFQPQQQQPAPPPNAAANYGAGGSSANPQQQHADPQARRVHNADNFDHDQLQTDWFSSIDDVERDAIDQSYNLFMDLHPDGLNFYDLRLALKALGFDLANGDVKSWVDKYGQPPSDWKPAHGADKCPTVQLRLPLDSYRHIAACLVAFRPQRELWTKAFAVFDVDKKGIITARDLRRASDQLGKDLSDAEIQRMIQEADIDDKGGVDLEEFIVIMERSSRKATTYA